MEKRPLKAGILGCGMIAHYHAKALLELPNVSLVGAFDINPESGMRFCKTYGIHCFDTMEQLLEFQEMDVVCICLPSGLHYGAAIACIHCGKHVILEKPMAFTSAQAEDIVCAARRAGVRVTVISQLRYTQSIRQLKEAVDAGRFGTIATVDIYMKYYRDPEYYRSSNWKGTVKMDGGGALMNQGIHGVDLLRYIAGPVRSVQALTATRCHSIETEDTVAAVVEYCSGALGVVQATTSVYPGFSRRMEICGTQGTAVLEEDTVTFSAFQNPNYNFPCGKSNATTGSRPDGMDHALHKEQIGDFLAALTEGTEPFLSGEEGKKAVEIIEAVYLSAKTGKKVLLDNKKEE